MHLYRYVVGCMLAACAGPSGVSTAVPADGASNRAQDVVRTRQLEIVDESGKTVGVMRQGMLTLEGPANENGPPMMFRIGFHELEGVMQGFIVLQARDNQDNKVGMGITLSHERVDLTLFDDRGTFVRLEQSKDQSAVIRQLGLEPA